MENQATEFSPTIGACETPADLPKRRAPPESIMEDQLRLHLWVCQLIFSFVFDTHGALCASGPSAEEAQPKPVIIPRLRHLLALPARV